MALLQTDTPVSDVVAEAREMAEALLADALPRRWAHTIGVAHRAERLAAALEPVHADTIIAAAWLHDIGYAPGLVDNGFHPIDGAAHVAGTAPDLRGTVNLIAHHTGAAFEAHERGLDSELAPYRFPVFIDELAILNAADLCTSPDGALIDPRARINEILDRYPPDHPVHQAITKSHPLLISQARLVMGAAEAARHGQRCVDLPERVQSVESGPSWCAVWSGDHRRVVTATRPAAPATGPGVVQIRFDPTTPLGEWEPEPVEYFDADVRAAAEAASGGRLNWHQYRAYEIVPGAGGPQQSAKLCGPTAWGSDCTFDFDDIARLQLDLAAQGSSIQVQQRTIATLSEVTQWHDIPAGFIDRPVDLRGIKTQ
jgi:HD domain